MPRAGRMAKLLSRITQLRIDRVPSWSFSYHTSVGTRIPGQCNGSAMCSLENRRPSQAIMSRSIVMARVQTQRYSMMVHGHTTDQNEATTVAALEDQSKTTCLLTGNDSGRVRKLQIGENISRKDKVSFLVTTLLDLSDSKEVVYGALDAWVAWEQNFPIGQLKQVLCTLEKEQQWHRVVQVIKWMLSKGQGNTMGTYGQLIKALDLDHRAEEAHEVWVKKIGGDLHSVPWQLCKMMISIYYRNSMLVNLVKLFEGLETFDRKPPEKGIVQKVANAYEILGQIEVRDQVLDKYKSLFAETERPKKSRAHPRKMKK